MQWQPTPEWIAERNRRWAVIERAINAAWERMRQEPGAVCPTCDQLIPQSRRQAVQPSTNEETE